MPCYLEQIFKSHVLDIHLSAVCSDKRLDKEKLREECKREIETYELDPIGKERKDVESCIVGIVEESRKKAHCRTHNSDSRTDEKFVYCRFFGNLIICVISP